MKNRIKESVTHILIFVYFFKKLYYKLFETPSPSQGSGILTAPITNRRARQSPLRGERDQLQPPGTFLPFNGKRVSFQAERGPIGFITTNRYGPQSLSYYTQEHDKRNGIRPMDPRRLSYHAQEKGKMKWSLTNLRKDWSNKFQEPKLSHLGTRRMKQGLTNFTKG